MEQTAVQWLIQDLKERKILPDNLLLLRWSIDKAKEMEKQQIIDAYETSHISMMSSEQYYNENFKK